MKTLIIFFPSIESGGVEKNFYYLLSYFCKKFSKIIVITSSKVNKNSYPNKIHFLSLNSILFNKGRTIKSIACFFLGLSLYSNKRKIILSFQSNIYSIILSKIINSKIIIRLNTSPDKYINTPLKKLIFKFFYNLSDGIIVNSFEFQKKLKKITKLNPQVIYNPIALPNKINKKKINFFKKFNNLKILSIGRLTDQKDHSTLIKSLNLLKNEGFKFKSYLIGRGYNYSKILSEIKNYSLDDYIKLGGYKKKAYQFMNDADLFVLTSKYEGLPNVLIEAQYFGIPIISSDCPSGPKEILINGRAGILFKTGNYHDLKNKIKFFVRNKKFFSRKIKFAKKNLFRFSNKIIGEKYYRLLDKQLNE